MSSTASTGNTGEVPREFASGKVLTVLGVPAAGGETLGFWIEAYLTAAVRGVRSAEVAGKIARHLGRFRDATSGSLASSPSSSPLTANPCPILPPAAKGSVSWTTYAVLATKKG